MRKLKLRRPSPALAVSIVALVVAMTGSAYAATQIHGSQITPRSITGNKIAQFTIGGGKLRQFTGGLIKPQTIAGHKLRDYSVEGNKIRRRSIGGGKLRQFTGGLIKPQTIHQNKLRPDSITRNQIDMERLGTVPSAERLAGDARFSTGLGFGEATAVAKVGPFTLTAFCVADTVDREGNPNRDVARLLIGTDEEDSVFTSGVRSMTGDAADQFLGPDTAANDRIVFEQSVPTGTTGFGSEGHLNALAPNGVGISSPQGANAAALNYADTACTMTGSVLRNN